MDNHEIHISIDSIDKAKTNGIVLLTFPPHCSHKLQPLDRTVYGPMKKYYNAACNSWMLSYPGKPMSIYDVAGVLGESFPRAFCPANIISGFKATGIYPFDSNVFSDEEFMSSFVTDRPETEQISGNETDGSTDGLQIPLVYQDHGHQSPVTDGPVTEPGRPTSQSESEHFSPEKIRPFPKAGVRKQNQSNRKKCRTSILTDTPEKSEREREARERNERPQRGAQPRLRDESSETESESEDLTSDLVKDSDQSEMSCQRVNVRSEDYVLVKLATKKVVRHYVGIVLTDPDKDDVVEVKFFSRMLTKSQPVFCNPDKEDISEVDVDDIVRKLPSPRL